MAIYNQNYDPNSYLTQGYQLPNQEIMGAINAKVSYYMQSLQQIRQMHDQAFDMKLTNEQNIQSLNNQRASVDENLRKVTREGDLSIGIYQQKAQDVLKPIMTNRSFLADEHLTSQIENGLSTAQSQAKNKGSNYMNMESVKALNNTLEDLRTADTSDPQWYGKFLNNPLGTTYVPYDPNVDKDYQAGLQKFLKDTRSKYSAPQTRTDSNGNPVAYYLSEQEVSTQTALDMQDYVRNNRPQQQKVQADLQSYNASHDLKRFMQQDPVAGRKYAIDYINGVKQNALNSDINVIHQTVNNLTSKQLAIASTDSEAYQSLQSYKEKLVGKDGKSGHLGEILSHYNSIHPEDILDNPADLAQLSQLYDNINVNSQIQAMGLDQVSQTLKADQSATSLFNNQANIQARLQAEAMRVQGSLQAAAMKQAGKNPDGTAISNPNITQSEDVGGATSVSGAEKLQTIQGQMLTNEDDVRKQFLSGTYAAVVPVDGKNINVLDAMQLPQYRNMPFKDFLDKVNLPQSARELLEALNADAYAQNDVAKTTLATPRASMAAARIMAAMHDDKTMSQVLQRAGADKGNEDNIGMFGVSLQDLKNRRKQLSDDYGGAIHQAVSGMKAFEGLSNEELIAYTEKDYVQKHRGDLLRLGLTDPQIKDLEETMRNGSPTGAFSAPSSDMNFATAVQSTIPNWNNLPLEPFIKEWKAFKDARETALSNTGKHLLANTSSFQVVTTSPTSDSFDPASQINVGQLPSLLSRAHTSLDGVNQNGKLDAAFAQIKGQLAPVIQSVQVFDDNSPNPYVRLNLDVDGAKKLLAAGKLQDIDNVDDLVENINNTRFYIPKEDLAKYHFGKESSLALDFANGNPVNYSLPSGNKINFRNAGTNGELSIVPDGRFSHINVYPDGTLEIADGDKLTPEVLQQMDRSGGMLKAIQVAPKEVAKQLYVLDYRAALLKNILQSNGINQNRINISELQGLKEKDRINNLVALSSQGR